MRVTAVLAGSPVGWTLGVCRGLCTRSGCRMVTGRLICGWMRRVAWQASRFPPRSRCLAGMSRLAWWRPTPIPLSPGRLAGRPRWAGAEALALLAGHGLEPAAALTAATTTGYRFLGESFNTAGQPATLVTYHDDPREDLAALSSPAAVIINGVRVR
jgi:hypothetical protein